jgi:mycothiol synthase
VDPVEVRPADRSEALALLARLEAATGIPPVDEDEQRRLAGHDPVQDPGWDWGGHLVIYGGTPVAYAGIRLPPARVSGCAARVDLAFDRAHPDAQVALAAALADARAHAQRHGTADQGRVEAWLRGATPVDLATAAQAGFVERGRLHVLGAATETLAHTVPPSPTVPTGLRLRAFDPDAPSDAHAVVDLLTRAYTELDGWYRDGFGVLRRTPWFRAEDLLLLESAPPDARLLALHWMKRRGGGTGEVYNLAVDPSAQGKGYGALLLDTGLHHLVGIGSREVVLWVDAANPRALALYRSRGFEPRWDDVSLSG